MLDKTKLAHLNHKLKLMKQENGKSTQEYLKSYSAMETEIKKEKMCLNIIDNAKQLQEEVAKIRKQQKMYDYIYILSMFLLLIIGLSFCCFFVLK